MQSLLGLGTNASVDINLLETSTRASRLVPSTDGKPPSPVFIYSSKEDITGEVKINIFGGKKYDHNGIRIELKGIVELSPDVAKANASVPGITNNAIEFVSYVKEVMAGGSLTGIVASKFTFPRPELPFESYNGVNGKIRYFLRAVVVKAGYTSNNLVKDQEILVQNIESSILPGPLSSNVVNTDSSSGQGVKLEVGIEDCLHIEFEYDKIRYHLTDVVTGRVDFLLVRIKIKHMEVALIRREAAGAAGAVTNDSETLTRFEVMDGAPIKGERIPIRLHLAGLDVGPTLLSVGNVLNVRYFLNLVLVDEEDRRYFKQQEITLYREKVKGSSSI